MKRWIVAALAVSVLAAASSALARRGPSSQYQLALLSGAGASSTSKRLIIASADGVDSVLTISSVAAGVGVAYPDTLGDGVLLRIEGSLGFAAYLYGNTILNGADTLNTTAYDSVVTQIGGVHLVPVMPMACAWKVKIRALAAADTVTVTVVRAPNWWTY